MSTPSSTRPAPDRWFSLHGRRAVVTGGNAGVGEARATALGLAGAVDVLVAQWLAELGLRDRQAQAYTRRDPAARHLQPDRPAAAKVVLQPH